MDPRTTYPLPGQTSRKTLSLIVLAGLLIVLSGFATWAFKSRQDYKNLSGSNAIASLAATQKAAQLQTQLDQANKTPYKTYSASVTNGSISFSYPKNWSAYVEDGNNSQPLNGYFYPDVVPSVQSPTAYALRLELVSDAYADIVGRYDSQVREGTVNSAAYLPLKMKDKPNVQPGVKLDGAISATTTSKGSMVVMRVRDKTLKIYSQSPAFASDFNDIILPSLTFSP